MKSKMEQAAEKWQPQAKLPKQLPPDPPHTRAKLAGLRHRAGEIYKIIQPIREDLKTLESELFKLYKEIYSLETQITPIKVVTSRGRPIRPEISDEDLEFWESLSDEEKREIATAFKEEKG